MLGINVNREMTFMGHVKFPKRAARRLTSVRHFPDRFYTRELSTLCKHVLSVKEYSSLTWSSCPNVLFKASCHDPAMNRETPKPSSSKTPKHRNLFSVSEMRYGSVSCSKFRCNLLHVEHPLKLGLAAPSSTRGQKFSKRSLPTGALRQD